MDVGGWLRRLGLERYEAAFRENEIDDSVLPSLTAEDLKDLGVGFVGHRRKLLDAIAALRAEANAPPPPRSDGPLAINEADRDTAERRQVTVMFSDLVGSTALSAGLDPEDLREVISAYQACVAETVVRFGGFVAKCMGDGVLVYFGYPLAHEDDAERAVRAGMELVAAIGDLKTHATLKTRIGIVTGALRARIAEVLETQFREIVEGRPELVAHHYTEAGLPLPSSRSTQRKLRLPMRSTLNSVDLHGTTGLEASILHAIAFGRLHHQSIAVRLILAPCSRSGNSHEQR